MGQKNYGGVYANIDFPPRVWQEYPKHIPTGNNKEYVVANSQEEEAKILSKFEVADDAAPAEPVNFAYDPDKEILISRAQELGIPINRKWSKAKLEALVMNAESEVDSLPAEMIITPEDELNLTPEELKDKLIVEAKALGIPANRLWGIPKLRETIKEFQAKKSEE